MNTQRVQKASDRLWLSSRFVDENMNILEIRDGQSVIRFVQNHVPVADDVFVMICKDKWFMYDVLKESDISLPQTLQYLNPHTHEKYTQFVKFPSLESIVTDIESQLSYPVVVKKSRWYLGINVFVCQTRDDVVQSIEIIFNNNKHYDYVCIVQEYKEIQHEYRVIIYKDTIQFVYEKVNHDAIFQWNLSPLHREGATAVVIEEKKILTDLERFVSGMSDQIEIPYAWLDIGYDEKGDYFLIEINDHPGYSKFVRDCGDERVVELFEKIVRDCFWW